MGEIHTTFLTVGFNTSREMTPEELDRLIVAVQAQIEEPPAASIEERRADFTTSNVTVWHESLQAYSTATAGLTDEEAGTVTGLADSPRCCYWKRCSELRQAGYISPTGGARASTAGELQQVCRITEAGMAVLA